jgi:two-component system NarL family sensor kinase
VRGNISATLLWMLGIAGLALLGLSMSGLWLHLSEQRIADQAAPAGPAPGAFAGGERARLARELHDGSSQTLVSTKLLLESALHAVQHGGPRPPTACARRWRGWATA